MPGTGTGTSTSLHKFGLVSSFRLIFVAGIRNVAAGLALGRSGSGFAYPVTGGRPMEGPWRARGTPQSKRGRRRRRKIKSNLTARILKVDSQNNDNAKSDNAYDVAVAECG